MAQLAINPAPDQLKGALERASSELRAAVISSDHVAAERALSCFAEALRNHWESLPPNERIASQIPARTRELLAWTREMTLIQRNLAADQLAVLRKASRYHRALSSEGRLEIQG